jgi:hypothetical protein
MFRARAGRRSGIRSHVSPPSRRNASARAAQINDTDAFQQDDKALVEALRVVSERQGYLRLVVVALFTISASTAAAQTTDSLGASGGQAFAALKPPTVTSKDVGFHAFITAGWRLSAARYHTLNRSEIIQVSPGVFVSVGNTTRDGWEAETKLAVTEGLGLYGSYGRILQARINSAAPGAQDRLQGPKLTVKGGASYVAPVGLVLNADASYISRVPYFAGNPLTLTYVRHYTRYDGRVMKQYRALELTVFGTAQPVQLGTEAGSATAAGLFLDPRPKQEFGTSLRYRFWNR